MTLYSLGNSPINFRIPCQWIYPDRFRPSRGSLPAYPPVLFNVTTGADYGGRGRLKERRTGALVCRGLYSAEQVARDRSLATSRREELRANECPEWLGALMKLIGQIQVLVLSKDRSGKCAYSHSINRNGWSVLAQMANALWRLRPTGVTSRWAGLLLVSKTGLK